MPVLLHILSFKLRSFLKQSIEFRLANVIKNVASLIVFGGFTIAAYYFARTTTAYLLETAHLGLFLLHRFLSMALFVFFISINVGNIIVSYATFYRSQETAFYFTKPISYVQLFIVKFIDIFFYSSTTLFLIAIAVLVGYGSYFNMSVVFYLKTMLLMIIPFMLISASIAVIMLLILISFSSKFGIKKIIGILVVMYLGSIFMYFKMSNPMRMVSEVLQKVPHVDEYFGYLDAPLTKYFPNHWIAESLYWSMRGEASYAVSYTVLLLIFSICIFMLMIFVAKKLFYKSWLTSLELQSMSESQPKLFKFLSLSNPSSPEIQTDVLLKKEYLQFIREPSQWIHMGIISILILTFIVSMSRINLSAALPFYQTVSYMVVFLFNAFLISSVALRFIYPIVSIEGESFWSVLSAPISRGKVFRIKFWLSFIPLAILDVLLILFSFRSLNDYPILIFVSLLNIIAVTFALVSLNLGAGIFFINYKEKNPIRVASSQSATIVFLISMMFLTLLVSIMFFPVQKYFEFIRRGGEFDYTMIYFGVLIVAILSLVIGFSSLIIGLRSFKRDY